jgi:hypothetical protein
LYTFCGIVFCEGDADAIEQTLTRLRAARGVENVTAFALLFEKRRYELDPAVLQIAEAAREYGTKCFFGASGAETAREVLAFARERESEILLFLREGDEANDFLLRRLQFFFSENAEICGPVYVPRLAPDEALPEIFRNLPPGSVVGPEDMRELPAGVFGAAVWAEDSFAADADPDADSCLDARAEAVFSRLLREVCMRKGRFGLLAEARVTIQAAPIAEARATASVSGKKSTPTVPEITGERLADASNAPPPFEMVCDGPNRNGKYLPVRFKSIDVRNSEIVVTGSYCAADVGKFSILAVYGGEIYSAVSSVTGNNREFRFCIPYVSDGELGFYVEIVGVGVFPAALYFDYSCRLRSDALSFALCENLIMKRGESENSLFVACIQNNDIVGSAIKRALRGREPSGLLADYLSLYPVMNGRIDSLTICETDDFEQKRLPALFAKKILGVSFDGLFADEDFSDILIGLCRAEFSAETEI